MSFRTGPLVVSLAVLAAAALPSADARACGGCFAPQMETQSTVVTGHRMAVSISPTQSVLWDQIKYAGSPSEFAWVLPVRPGTVIELSTDAWFETLDAATSAQIISPPINCGSSGGGCSLACASDSGPSETFTTGAAGPPSVTVVHQGTIGPYATVTLHANVPNALPAWLDANAYAIDPTIAPVIDAYTAEGFDFIALRLRPDQGVQQMKPVRVVTPGMNAALPLRMVAAGTGANVAITLFVIGEGRWEPQNFPSASVDPSALTWDFGTQSSDYATFRQTLLAAGNGRTWNSAFAHQGSLLSQDLDAGGSPLSITVGQTPYPTLGAAYVAQGVSNGETASTYCVDAFTSIAQSTQVVDGECLVPGGALAGGTGGGGTGGSGNGGSATGGSGNGGGDVGTDGSAPDGGGTGGDGTGTGTGGGAQCSVASGAIDASQLACGGLDDIAVALVGLHPRDVWLTRLKADLPRAALATDLQLQASASQQPVSNLFNLTRSKGDPCAVNAGFFSNGRGLRNARLRNELALLATILLAIGAAVGRRLRRPFAAGGFDLQARAGLLQKKLR